MAKIKLVSSVFYNDRDTREKLSKFILETDQLSIGEQVEEFEKEFAEWQGRKYCVMFNSGSSANLALLQALKNMECFEEGDTAGHSAITWATNVMPLIQMGLEPVAIDIERWTLNVPLWRMEKVTIMFLTHLLGMCGELDGIADYCYRNGIILIEDTCEALGSVYKGKKLGNWGLASTFSFFVGHHLSTIEGGAVCTDDGKLATMLNMVRAHGWDRNLTPKPRNKNFIFHELGYNLRPTEITGFLGRNQLKYADEITEKRVNQFERMSNAINKNDDIASIDVDMDTNSAFSIPLVFDDLTKYSKYKEKFEPHVETRQIVGGSMPEQPFYRRYVSAQEASMAKEIGRQGFYFSNSPQLTDGELDTLEELCQK